MTKFNAAGSALVYSTFLGGISPAGIAVDSAGDAYVTGSTYDAPPLKNAFQATAGGGGDAFVTKLNATGSALVYSTYLGGSGQDYATGIAVDRSGDAYVTGDTASSTNFPTTPGSLQPGRRQRAIRPSCPSLNPAGSALVYSTYPRRLGRHLCQWHRRGRFRQRLCDGLFLVGQLPDDARGLPDRFCRRRLRGEVECHGFGTGLCRPARGRWQQGLSHRGGRRPAMPM